MPENKYVPVRKCIACRQVKPQNDLLRIAVTASGLFCDPDRLSGGRGCYLCMDSACVKTAFEKNSFARALKKRIPPEDLKTLRDDIEKNI